MHGDDNHTLSLACHEQIEAEANFAAGQLLFMQNKFQEIANDIGPSIDSLKQLKKVLNNTLTTTFWRLIESTNTGLPMIGLISPHPSRLPP